MLPELFAWFIGREVNRRKYPRKREPYRATFSVDSGVTQKPMIGLDISGGGLCVLSQEPVGKEEFEVRATIETAWFAWQKIRLARYRYAPGRVGLAFFGMRFTGISADD